MKTAILIGYSGHAYVAADIILKAGYQLLGYCDLQEKPENPLRLAYLGPETGPKGRAALSEHPYFIAVGDNRIREKVWRELQQLQLPEPMAIQHPSAVHGLGVEIGPGAMLAARAVLNPYTRIGRGAICNTGCIIEHECHVGDFAHIAPGAVLAGNVSVGPGSFVGAHAVVKQGVRIGSRAIIGAGAVVLRDVPDGVTVVGNPGSILPRSRLL